MAFITQGRSHPVVFAARGHPRGDRGQGIHTGGDFRRAQAARVYSLETPPSHGGDGQPDGDRRVLFAAGRLLTLASARTHGLSCPSVIYRLVPSVTPGQS